MSFPKYTTVNALFSYAEKSMASPQQNTAKSSGIDGSGSESGSVR